MTSGPYPGVNGQRLNFGQIEQLWTSNGGSQALAPTMAAIALEESGGQTNVLNNTPSTGDYSVGLWQINYYDSLLGPRTQAYGAPATLAASPNAQAKAAISLAGDGSGLSNWTSYSSGRYKQYLNGAAPYSGPNATLTSASGSQSGSQSGCSGCAINLPSLGPVGGGCLLTSCNLKALKGGLLLIAGGGTFMVGALILVAYGFSRTSAGKSAVQASKAIPGNPVGAIARNRAYNAQTSRQVARTRQVEQVRTEHAVTRSEAAGASRRYGATKPRSEPSPAATRPHRRQRPTASHNSYGEEWL